MMCGCARRHYYENARSLFFVCASRDVAFKRNFNDSLYFPICIYIGIDDNRCTGLNAVRCTHDVKYVFFIYFFKTCKLVADEFPLP